MHLLMLLVPDFAKAHVIAVFSFMILMGGIAIGEAWIAIIGLLAFVVTFRQILMDKLGR